MITTLTGDNSFGLKSALDKLVTEFVAKNSDMALDRLDGEEESFQQIYDAITGLPFLARKKMVVLKGPSLNREFVEKAEALLSNLPDVTDIILVEPKLDKRTAYFKFLKAATDFREFIQLDSNNLVSWAVQYAKTKKGSLGLAEARFLVERIGINQQLVASEIEKLILYDAKITHQNIELMIELNPQSSVFELLDSAFAGNKKRTMSLYYEQRVLKVEPQQIIAMMAWQLHILAIIKTAGDQPNDQISSLAKLNPFVVRKSSGIASKLSLTELRILIAELLQLDIKLKSQSIDADEALQYFLLNLRDRI